jgi:hypothetical protein
MQIMNAWYDELTVENEEQSQTPIEAQKQVIARLIARRPPNGDRGKVNLICACELEASLLSAMSCSRWELVRPTPMDFNLTSSTACPAESSLHNEGR